MIPILKILFKKNKIRSINRIEKDKRFCLNILKQLLKIIGYYLKSKTYQLIHNNKITTSTKYRINIIE